MNQPLMKTLLGLTLWIGPNVLHALEIQRSIAFPVTNQTVTFTVPGLGEGGMVEITRSTGEVTQLLTNPQEQAAWTPPKYGNYTLSAGGTTDTMWVTARPMKFHWWSCTTAQKNVTEVMRRDAAWQARGVNRVDWTGGDYLSSPEHGGYTTAQQWYDNWTYAYDTGGMALDEMWCDDVARTNAMLQAISMVREARGPGYSINVWSAGFGSNFAAGAANFKANNVTVLIEDYYGGWNNHKSRWDAVRSYGLQNQAISGIWPGTTNLTNVTQLRTDVALVRLAAPNANGIAIFAPTDQSYTPKDLPTVLRDCDEAIEDYYLKPLIHLSVTQAGKIDAWNLGNDDALGFSLQLLNGALGVVQTVDLSMLVANGHQLIDWPAGAVHAKVIHPAGTANLYVGNSQYSNGLYRLQFPGRYTFTNANGDNLWSTFSSWDPHGPPPGNIDSGNSAYFDGNSPVTVAAAGGETSISSVLFKSHGWTLNGNPTSQNLFTYGVTSEGSGTNTIKIGYRTSAGVPASFNVGTGNTLAMDGLVTGPGGLLKQGAGTLMLSWNNNYAGTTSINAGHVVFKAPGNANWVLPTGAKTIDSGCSMKVDFTPQSPTQYRTTQLGPTTVNTGGVLDLHSTAYNIHSWHLINGWSASGGGTIRVAGGGAIGCWTGASNALAGFTGLLDIQNGQFACNIDSVQTLGGTLDINVAATGKLDMRSGSMAVDSLDGALGSSVIKSYTGDTVTLTVGNANGSGAFAGNLTGSNYHLTKNGSGTQLLSGTNSFSGTTTINNGTLALSGGAALADAGAVVLANAAGAQLLLNASETIGSLAGGGASGGNVNLQDNTLTVGNATNTTFGGSLSGSGGVVKVGTGTLTFSGANDYSGDTTVNAGVLSLNSAFLANSSTVTIASGAALNLNTGASDTVGSLVLGGTTVPAGIYNASHPAYGSFFTGSGSLIVDDNAFDSWTSSYGLAGADALPAADPDMDDVANAVEFVLGSEPNPANPGATSNALLPTVSHTATHLVFTFRRSDLANAMSGIGIDAEFGSELAGWAPAIHGTNGVTIVETDDGFGAGMDQVEVSIPKTLAVDSKLFVRLKVTLP